MFSYMRGSSKKAKKAGVIFLLCVVFLVLLILFNLLIVSLLILLVFFIFSGRVRLLRRTHTRWSMAKHVADPKVVVCCNLLLSLLTEQDNFRAKQLGVMEFQSKFVNLINIYKQDS